MLCYAYSEISSTFVEIDNNCNMFSTIPYKIPYIYLLIPFLQNYLAQQQN